MRSLLHICFLLVMTSCFSLVCINFSEADVDLPWSTTFNCADWTQGQTANCNGISKGGDWVCTPQNYGEQITSAANHTWCSNNVYQTCTQDSDCGGGTCNGLGSKGDRHWDGDGVNNDSGSIKVNFNTSQNEVWIRWYIRYQSGFKWSGLGYDKLIYFNEGQIPEWYGLGGFRLAAGGNSWVCSSGCGWNTIYPGGVSDGSWHCLEIHVNSSGVFQYWLDGVKKMDMTNITPGTYPLTGFGLLVNQKTPNNGGCYSVDVDDIAISNTGYIGPLGGSPVPPSPPKNLNIQ